MDELTTTGGDTDERIELGADCITVYANKFSAYAVSYTNTVYNVSVETGGNGTVEANPTSATMGTEITLTPEPQDGYKFREWQVVSGGVTVKDNKFTMPAGDVTVKAIFASTGSGDDTDPIDPGIQVGRRQRHLERQGE